MGYSPQRFPPLEIRKTYMRVLHVVLVFILLLAGNYATASEPMESAIEQTQTLVERMKVFDTEGVANLTYTRFFERMGIDPARPRKAMADLNDKLKSMGAKYISFSIQPIDKPFAGDGQLYIIVPYSNVMEVNGRRILQEAFFIGVSEDEGKNWKFVDGISSTQQNIRTVIPSYSGAPLPPRRQKPIE